MKRSGRILTGIACAALWCAAAGAESGPGMPAPSPKAAAKLNALRQKMILENKAFLQKRHLAASPMAMPGFPAANTPPAAVPEAPANAVATDAADTAPNTDTPYGSIVTRNVFALVPIPKVDPNAQIDNGPPPPKITLTGITTIFGPAEALFKAAGIVVNGKPQDKSYILQEGQSEDDIDVTAIDTAKDVVTFNNHGEEQVIPLTVGVASGGGPASGGAPQPANPFMRRFNGNLPQNIRERLQQRYGNQASFNSGGNNYSPAGQNNFNNGYSYGGNNSYNQNNAANATPQLSGDDAAAIMAAEHAQAVQQNKPYAAIFPPTKYDRDAGVPPMPSGDSSITP